MGRWWQWSWIVCCKEMLDGIRDRRSVLSTLIIPLMAPAMMVFMFNTLAERQRAAGDEPVYINGAENAPQLVEWIKQQDVKVLAGPDNAKEAVREGETAAVLVIPPDFMADFTLAKSAEVELIQDGSRPDFQPQVHRLRQLLRAYSRHMANLRLIVRGVSPELAQPLDIAEIDVASARQRSVMVLSFIPIFVILSAFMAGANIAIDGTAGERERRSLEPLLINPVSRHAIVVGKWGACVVFAFVGVALTLLYIGMALTFLPLAELGLQFSLGFGEVVGVLASTLPLAFLASGLQLLVSTFARSFKEAQTYISMLIFLPTVPTVIDAVNPLGRQDWMAWVPLLGQQVLLKAVLGGETPGGVVFCRCRLSVCCGRAVMCVGDGALILSRRNHFWALSGYDRDLKAR
jgi:sodium transport system permease protein